MIYILKMVLDGIGTAAPSSRLHINGGTASHATGLTFGDGDTGFYEHSDDSMWYFSGGVNRWKSDSSYLFSTTTTSKATIINEVASATNPVFTFYNDLDTGLGWAAADKLSLVAGGAGTVTVTSTAVGIGTTSPDSKLMIQGGNYNSSLKIKGSGPTSGIQFVDSDNNTDGYVYAASGAVGFLDSGTHWMVKCENDSFISFSTNNGTEHMRIKSDGKVGIGVTDPSQALTVKTPASGDAFFIKDRSSTDAIIRMSYGGATDEGLLDLLKDNSVKIRFRANAASYMMGGSFGIGTTSPAQALHVHGNAVKFERTNNAVALQLYNNSASPADDAALGYLQFMGKDNDGTANIVHSEVRGGVQSNTNSAVSGYLAFLTTNNGTAVTEHMRIKADGNVGIGTTSPLSKFNVKGAQGNWRVDPDSVSSEIQVLSTTVANDGFRSFRLRTNETIFDAGGSERMRIKSDGKVGIGMTPTTKLSVKSTGSNADEISLVHSGNTVKLVSLGQESSHGSIHVRANSGVAQARISAVNSNYFLQNVGIGTTAPASLLDLRTTRAGSITSGTGHTGSVLTLHNEAQWESGYATGGATPDFLGGIEFSTGDTSAGEGVRAAIRATVDNYYNTNSLTFYTANQGDATLDERLRIAAGGAATFSGIVTLGNNSRLSDATTADVYLNSSSDVMLRAEQSNAVFKIKTWNGSTQTERFKISGAGATATTTITGDATVSNDLVVTGNFTVNGTATTIDTTNLLIEDPLMLLAKIQTGTPTLDSGFIIERGSSTNVGMIWDESLDEFAFINTTDTATTAGNVTIASYANLQANAITVGSTYIYQNYIRAANIRVTDNAYIGSQSVPSVIQVQGDGDVAIGYPLTVNAKVGIGANASTPTLLVKAHSNGWDGGINLTSADGTFVIKLHPENGTSYGLMINNIVSFNGSGVLKFGTTTVIDTSRNAYFAGGTFSEVMNLSGVNKIHQLSGHNFVQGDATMTYLYGGSGGGQIRTTNNASSLVQWLDNGRVGIGTTAPSNQLTIESGTTGESISDGLRLQNSHGVNNDISPIYFGVHGGTRRAKCGIGWKRTGSYGIGKLLFALDNNGDDADVSFANDTKVTFQGDGKVGIGTTAPTAKLFVMGDSTARAFQAVSSSAANATGYFYTNMVHTGVDTSATVSIRSDHASSTGQILHVRGDGSGNLLTLDQGGTNRFIVKADGKVGIGTTAPRSLLEVGSAGLHIDDNYGIANFLWGDVL